MNEEQIKVIVEYELGRIEKKIQAIVADLKIQLDGYSDEEKERLDNYPIVKARWKAFKTALNIVKDQRLGHDKVVTRTKED